MKQNLSGYDHRLVRRIAAIINCIGTHQCPIRLVDIADHTGLDNATAYRILSELVREGYVHKNKDTRCYTPGFQICQLGASDFAHTSVIESLQPWLGQIEQLTGFTAILGSRKGSMVQLYQRPSPIARHPGVSEALCTGFIDAHATAIGKILLSTATLAEMKALYANGAMQKYTSRTTSNVAALIHEMQQVRRAGYAVEYGEFCVGLHGIGVLVPTRVGQPGFGVWLTTSSEQSKGRLNAEAVFTQASAILEKAVNPGTQH